MASPAPAKSQPLHNFPLPSLWSKNHPRPRRPSKTSITRLDSPSIITDPTVQNHPPPPVSDHTKSREEKEGEEREGGESEEEELAKTWNLRPRKQLVIKKRSVGSKNGLAEEKRGSDGEVKKEKEKEKEKRERFSISLSRIEIEEDFFAMTGCKPSRRPKKRNKSVQKQLDDIFPGMWLDSITPDSYKVNEAPDKP